jgi:hypothetical protein
MGVMHPYYLTIFYVSMILPLTIMMIPIYHYAVINPDTKFITKNTLDQIVDYVRGGARDEQTKEFK